MFISKQQFNKYHKEAEDKEVDVITYIASEELNVKPEDVTLAQREEVKMAVYVWLYGTSQPITKIRG